MFVGFPPECGMKGNYDWIWHNQLPVAVTVGRKARNHCGFRERESERALFYITRERWRE